MLTKQFFAQGLAWTMILLLAAPPVVWTQQESASAVFKQEELDQILAPIALYPDSLISQILMASTYPLEIVEAARWAKQNQNLKGDALAQALEKQSWDPSVRSLVNFPDVLSKMNDKLDWTQKLGDAFLSQQKDVMDAIQNLRVKAQSAGNLKTTEQQKVIVEEKIIKIEPASPTVVYVPTYNPTVVYGAWPYPAYPPYPWYPPGYVFGSMFAFGAGVALGAAWGYAWGNANWRGGNVDVNVNRNTNFNTNINRNNFQQNNQGKWQHDASHRKGVSYRDNATAQQYGRGSNNQAVQARESYRGRADAGRQQLPAGGGGQQLGDRQGIGQGGDAGGLGGPRASQQPAGGGNRQGVGQGGDAGGLGGPRASQQPAGGLSGNRQGGSPGQGAADRGGGAFQGIDRGGSSARTSSNRGATSRQSYSGGGGGASRGGGGGGGGARGGGGGGGGRRR